MKVEDLIENGTYVLKTGELIILTRVSVGFCVYKYFGAGGGAACVPSQINYQFSRTTHPEFFL